MKSVLSLLFVAGAALSFSTSYYGWVPQKEFTYRFESQVLTGIPEIKSQFSGLKIKSLVKIQTFPDYSLRVKFVDPEFLTLNEEEVPSVDGRPVLGQLNPEAIPESVRRPLTEAFEVHLKRGVVESLFVPKNEPVVVTNLKKALLSQIQMDLSASREGQVMKLNHVALSPVVTAQEEMRNESFFSTMETSLHGDCETSYTLHPLPLYQARELEEQWRVHKVKVVKSFPGYNNEENVLRESVEAQRICEGQQYYQVTKTKNFDNCRERPVFASWSGVKGSCDLSKSNCEDLMNHMSTTQYVICGNPEQFTIRKVTAENVISTSPLGYNTQEKLRSVASVDIELLKVESSGFQPIPKPEETKKIENLFMEYPEHKTLSSRSIAENGLMAEDKLTGLRLKTLTGFYPVHPMPELDSAPLLLFPTSLPKPELYNQVKDLMHKIIRESFESPESCTSSSDVAGHIFAIAKALRPLSTQELKEVRVQVIRYIQEITHNHKSVETAKFLFNDILSMVSTNPSVVVIKELIESEEIPREYASQILQSTLKHIKTPTPELFNLIFSLVKTVKSKSTQLMSVSALTFSDLLHRACVDPSSMVVEFPVHIYGNFCNPETSFIKEQYIPFLENQLEGSSHQKSQEKLVWIHALGKLGHYEALKPLVKVIEGKLTENPLIRSVAVRALKRVSVQYPSKVRPLILSLIDNPAENPEVRIAAVSVLPFTSPSVSEFQKIALRTWFEPSKQVTSFIYSTLKSLKTTEIPEFLPLRSKVQNIMVKPVQTGIQFSHNIHSSKFIEVLKVVSNNLVKIVNTENSLIPEKISFSSNLVSRSWKVQGLSFSVYSRGMDYLIEKAINLANLGSENMSQSVRSELQKIDEKLQIKKRLFAEPEAHFRVRFMGLERIFSFDSDMYFETLRKVTDNLSNDPSIFSQGMKYQYAKAQKLIDVQTVIPSDCGFPMFSEVSSPMVFSVQGSFNVTNKDSSIDSSSSFSLYSLPTAVKSEMVPTLNVKFQTVLGVISPFTKQYIGAGVELGAHSSFPLATKISMNSQRQVSLTLKTPEKVQKEIELVHLNVKPFSFKKSMETITPISQSAGHKKILSGHPLKKFEANPLKNRLDAPFKIVADYPALDMVSVFQKLRMSPNPLVAVQTLTMPFSIKYASLQLKFNPVSSSTKELETRFTLAHGSKVHHSEPVRSSSFRPSEEVEKMCKENHLSESEISECVRVQQRSLESISDISHQDRLFCQRQVELEEPSHFSHVEKDSELRRCLESVKVCEQAKRVCSMKRFNPSEICQEKKNACRMRHINLMKVNSILNKLQHGSASSIAVEGFLNSHYEKKGSSMIVSGGIKKVENNRVESFAEVEVETPNTEPVIVQMESVCKLPEIKFKWDKEQMINGEISYKSDTVFRYGYKSTPKQQMKKIVLDVLLSKTESQKESIRRSEEYSRCVQMESEGRRLAPVCEKIRHQASSVDKMFVKIQTPHQLTDNKYSAILRQTLEAVFYPYIKERVYESQSVSTLTPNEITLEGLVSRQGQEATLKFRHPGFEWDIEEIRMPQWVKNVLPLSLRNGASYRFLQKATSQQTPASCRIEPQFVSTFDNKTFQYSINDCEHLLVKDCSGSWPFAVTAKGSSSGHKEIKIVAGFSVVELKPVQGSVLSGVYVDGHKIELRPGQVYVKPTHYNEKPSLKIVSFLDGVVVVKESRSSSEVSFDGQRVEIVAPQIMRFRSCGICGDMNGENTADLKTPKMCVFQKARIAAYSYMMKTESCRGIPAQDKTEFEQECRQCIKKTTLMTPLEDLVLRSVKVISGPNGIVSKHIVVKRANGNELCISKMAVPACEGGSKPIIGQKMSVPFTCIPSHYRLAKHIENLALSNEVISPLMKFHTSYTQMVDEPIQCSGHNLRSSPSSEQVSRPHQPSY